MRLYRQIAPSQTNSYISSAYFSDGAWSAATDVNRVTLRSPSFTALDVGGNSHSWENEQTLSVDSASSWDTTSGTDYSVAANRAGLDFYIYACQSVNTAPTILLSANSTYPSGYTGSDSRKIGGFHCLCLSVGTISGHTLSGYLTGDILPQSVWSHNWKADALSNAGLVLDPKLNKWVGIYLTSGSVASPTIRNNGTILDTITWYQACDAATAIYMRLPKDFEFQVFAAGSPEGVNIYNSADPATTTGHISTGSVRMISNIGCEDCCGVMWQWLDETSYRFDNTTSADTGFTATNHTHSVSLDGEAQASVTSGTSTQEVGWSWKNKTGGKGQLYTQGTYGVVKATSGGDFNDGSYCGSRGRSFDNYPWITTGTNIATRFIANHINKVV